MNTYYKFVPNVFIAKCTEKHEKGETISLETKYGNEHECIVFNLMGQKDGFYFYSIVRADGYNVQEKAKAKHEGLKNGTIKREHSYSLTYAKKELNEAEAKLKLAKRLWS